MLDVQGRSSSAVGEQQVDQQVDGAFTHPPLRPAGFVSAPAGPVHAHAGRGGVSGKARGVRMGAHGREEAEGRAAAHGRITVHSGRRVGVGARGHGGRHHAAAHVAEGARAAEGAGLVGVGRQGHVVGCVRVHRGAGLWRQQRGTQAQQASGNGFEEEGWCGHGDSGGPCM